MAMLYLKEEVSQIRSQLNLTLFKIRRMLDQVKGGLKYGIGRRRVKKSNSAS